MIQESFPENQFRADLRTKHKSIQKKKKPKKSKKARAITTSNNHVQHSDRLQIRAEDSRRQERIDDQPYELRESQSDQFREDARQIQKPQQQQIEKINQLKFDWMMGSGKKKRKSFYCECGYRTLRGYDGMRHIKSCKKRGFGYSNQIQQFEQHLREGESFTERGAQIDLLQDKIQRAVDYSLDRKLFEISQNGKIPVDTSYAAKQIYSIIEYSIKDSIILNLSALLETKMNESSTFLIRPKQIARQALRIISQLDFNRCVVSIFDELKKAHESIQKNTDKQSRTYKNNERCYHRLLNFKEVDFRNSHRLLDIAISLSRFVREELARYFNLARKRNLYLAELPPFPQISEQTAKRSRVIPMSFIQAANQIQQIFLQNRQLASDMWGLMTLGLRSSDLLKILFRSNDGSFCKVIRLCQKKTKSTIVRYIPRSLIQIVVASGASYPMSKLRLQLAVRQCLRKFHSAYGFKHKALTEIITTLAESNNFIHFHRNIRTTMKYYLDNNEERLLDHSFKLGISFVFEESIKKIIDQRSMLLDLVNPHKPVFQPINEERLTQITIDCREDMSDRLISSVLDRVEPNNEVMDSCKEEHLGEIYYVNEKHGVDISQSEVFDSIESCLSSIFDSQSFLQLQSAALLSNPNSNVLESYSQAVKIITGKDVELVSFDEQQSKPIKVFSTSLDQNHSDPSLVISTVSLSSGRQRIKSVPLAQMRILPKRRSKQIAKNLMRPGLIVKNRCPRCPHCAKEKKVSFMNVGLSGAIQCNNCDYSQRYQPELQPIHSQGKCIIKCTGQFIDLPITCPKRMKNNKNNIQKQMGDQFSVRHRVSPYIPSYLECNFSNFQSIAAEISRFNLSVTNLPFQIRKSSIEGAGKGIFALQTLPIYSLVGIYTGYLTLSSDVDTKSNSLYTVGWVTLQGYWCAILIDGNMSNSGSRFINSNSIKRNNVSALEGVYDKTLTVIYYTSRQVKIGQQLFVSYGPYFDLTDQDENIEVC